LTSYTAKDYEWVKKIINKNPKGIALKKLIEYLNELGIQLGKRTRDEKPPGREKIRQNVTDYNGKDWKYEEGGGKSKKSIVIPIKYDKTSGFGNALREIRINSKRNRLEELYQKKELKFTLLEVIEFYNIKKYIISFPVKIFSISTEHGHDKDMLFMRAMSVIKDELKRIRRIETIQKKINKKFEKTLMNLEQIENSNILEAEIYGSRNKKFVIARNNIRDMYKIKPKK